MNRPLVMKFGGAGLADGAAVQRVCDIVVGRAGEDPVIVVSAHLGVTSRLEECANEAAAGRIDADRVRVRHRGLLRELSLDPELLDRHFGELWRILSAIRDRGRLLAEELDYALSFGERMSARVVAAALRRHGLLATPVDAFDLGLTTDSCFGRARPLPGARGRLRDSLAGIPGIPVVTGFLARDDHGNLTTLGRDGSDLTAMLVARAVGARVLEFWKNVPGILTADPGMVPEARVIATLAPEAAAELAFHGARVLHPRALDPEAARSVSIRVRNVDAPDEPGTELRADEVHRAPVAIAGNAELVGITLPLDGGRGPAELLALLHARHVEPRFVHGDGGGLTAFAPPGPPLEGIARELSGRARLSPIVSSVVVVGGGGAVAGEAALRILQREGLSPLRAFLGAGASQAFLVDPADRAAATRALHAGLFASVPA